MKVREKTDKFQQRRLDGFFKAGAKAADDGNAVEETEPPAMPEVMAMEVEMEVGAPQYPFPCRHSVPSNVVLVSLSLQTHGPFQCQLNVPFGSEKNIIYI